MATDSVEIRKILEAISNNHLESRRTLHLTPSENVLSPGARLPLILDLYSRYFFDHKRILGTWTFYGAIGPGQVELSVLIPMLRKLAKAQYVTVRPLSGLNCMTIAMAALARHGDTVVTVPLEQGGHMSTPHVAERLGLKRMDLPMNGPTSIDLPGFERLVAKIKPAVVYLDQSIQLVPLDPQPLRKILDHASPTTRIHFDSSHINGLILGGALQNPLERGATSFGGSTHKTLPGPHKGFLATNDEDLWERFYHFADHFVSHHQIATVMSLAITVSELIDCGGNQYACQILENARYLASRLVEEGIEVAGEPGRWTECHQVWVSPGPQGHRLADALYELGLVVNCLPSLPGMDWPSLRLSVAEITRLGASQSHIDLLAKLLAECILAGEIVPEAPWRLTELRQELDRPHYCYSPDELADRGLSSELVQLVSLIAEQTSYVG